MDKVEAAELLGLKNPFSSEKIFEAYKKTYLNVSRSLSKKNTESSAIKEKLMSINSAFISLSGSNSMLIENTPSILLDLGVDELVFKNQQAVNFDVFPEFHRLIEKSRELAEAGQYGLAIRLMEIGIQRSFQLNRYKAFTGQRRLSRSLGKLLLDIGLKDKGMELLTAGSINYYIGKTYFEIKDYQSAILYFGRELKEKETSVSREDIILSIVKCYFLLGEYKNCLHIVERVLPNFESSKKRGWNLPEKASKMLLFCISKEENLKKGMLVKFKLKLKFPVSYRCIAEHIESFNDGLKFLDDVKDETALDEFLKSIEPDFKVKENIDMSYTEERLNEMYYEVFAEPLNASELYNKK